MKLLLFNPETEYALASGASFYTPPSRVEKYRKDNQLLPEAWAEEGDMILVDDVRGIKSDYKLVQWDMLGQLFSDNPDIEVEPWGWNAALVRKLLDNGVPQSKLPTEDVIARIRCLAHRRTTISLISMWNDIVDNQFLADQPVELTSICDCMDFYKENPGCWMKAPWSSSGRGVINTSADMTDILVEQWCRGILRRQGCVMGETGASRKADYAVEWKMHGDYAEYLGLSSFSTSNRGKYIANHILPQSLIKEKFDAESTMKIDAVIALQRPILECVLKGYRGLLGVDMIVERNGKLRPFVELNLRRTMGMLYIKP